MLKNKKEFDQFLLSFWLTVRLFLFPEGSQPISLFQVPAYCGYSVEASAQGLAVIVPYGACYMIQKVAASSAFFLSSTNVYTTHYLFFVFLLLFQNGSHILPLLWLGIPMKLSCLAQPAIPAPSVFCSSTTMAVQMMEQEPNRPMLKVLGLSFSYHGLFSHIRKC